jgi:hypothetical protein
VEVYEIEAIFEQPSKDLWEGKELTGFIMMSKCTVTDDSR